MVCHADAAAARGRTSPVRRDEPVPAAARRRADAVLALQRGAGNAAVARLLAERPGRAPAGRVVARVLHVGEGPAAKAYDMKTIETLVDELVTRRKIPSVAAKKRTEAEADIRAAVLVFYRNDRHFVDIGVLEGAVEDRLQDQQLVRDMDWSKDEATVAQEHPERGKFLAALAGVIEPAAALRLWDLTIKGVRLQPTLSDKDWKNNPHYRELSTGFAQQLQMREGGRFALWTGGYDVSMYAQGHGYFTLEMTRAGKIYDQLKLFKQFSALGEMWNNISRQFVQSAFGEVHVFLRTFDPSSVMMTEELPEAVMLEGVTTVKWHLLKGDKLADLTEVDPADQPVASYAFDSYRDVATLMQTRRFNDKNKAWVEKRSLLPSEKQAMKEQVLLEGALVVPDQFRAVEDDVRARSNMYDLDESDPAVAAELEQIRQRGLLAIRSGTRIDHVREFVAEAVQRTRRKVLSVGEMRELQRHAETLAMSMRVHNDKRVAEIVEEAKDVGLKAQQAGRIGDALAAGRSHIDEALTKVAV